MVTYINPAKHAPGVRIGHARGLINSHRLTVEKNFKNLHKAQSLDI